MKPQLNLHATQLNIPLDHTEVDYVLIWNQKKKENNQQTTKQNKRCPLTPLSAKRKQHKNRDGNKQIQHFDVVWYIFTFNFKSIPSKQELIYNYIKVSYSVLFNNKEVASKRKSTEEMKK